LRRSRSNQKNIDVSIPREKLVVITGLSGSGKSSLAFDTIYAEGQRRYVETFSAYARQFFVQMSIKLMDFLRYRNRTKDHQQKPSFHWVQLLKYNFLRLLYARAWMPIVTIQERNG
jgi:excinuclease ABC subunit A